jgi:hypothetical protein
MDAQDMILDEITRKQLIWYSHVERMDPTRLAKIMIHWKPEGRKKRALSERDMRMGGWNNRRQWNMAVGRCRQKF